MIEAELDAHLKRAMMGRDRLPDEAFVARVVTAVQAEEQVAALRFAARRRFLVEAAGSMAIAIALFLLWRLIPVGGDADLSRFAPVNAAVLVFAVWLVVGLQNSSGSRST